MIEIRDEGSVFTAEYATAQTGTDIITPPSGQRVRILEVFTTTAATSGEIFLFAGSAIAHKQYVGAAGQSQKTGRGFLGGVDAPIELTTTTSTSKVFVWVKYQIEG